MRPADYAVPAPVLAIGDKVIVEGQDTVTCAPELVRLTGNIAFTHTDASRSYLGQRLVYGGHTISLAFAQLTRAMPNLICLLAWQGCDHLGPVLEEDIIGTTFSINNIRDFGARGKIYEVAAKCTASRPENEQLKSQEVLDWRPYVWSL